MAAFVLAIILIIAGTITIVFGLRAKKTASKRTADEALISGKRRTSPGGAVAVFIGIGLIALGGLLTFAASIYTQDVGEAMVITTPGGQIAGTDTDPGYGFKAPWNGVSAYDIRNQVIAFTGNGEGEGISGPAITGQTKDGTSAAIDLAIRYSINPGSVESIYREYRTQENLITRALYNDVRSVVRDATIAFPTTSMRQERAALASSIQEQLDKRWIPLGVTVDSVDLRNIGYPQEIEDSLKQVQTSLNNVERAKAELETARVEAEKVKTEAQAQSDADQIIRCGATTTTVSETVNGKEITAIKVIPVPSDKCQNRLNEQVLTAKYIEMLKAAAAAGNTVYVIPPDQSTMLNLGSSAAGTSSTPAP